MVVRQFGAWDEALQDAFFEERWAPERLELIEEAGRRVGCLGCRVLATHVWIDEIQILPESQGRGVGSALLRRLLDDARSRGLPVRLQVLKANHRARELYLRLGFAVSGEAEKHVLMEWTPP